MEPFSGKWWVDLVINALFSNVIAWFISAKAPEPWRDVLFWLVLLIAFSFSDLRSYLVRRFGATP